MKTELRPGLAPNVIELYYDGALLGVLTGDDGPGVVLVSDYIRNTGTDIVLLVTEPPELRVRLDHRPVT